MHSGNRTQGQAFNENLAIAFHEPAQVRPQGGGKEGRRVSMKSPSVRLKTFAGFDYDFSERNTVTTRRRKWEEFYHKLMIEESGFWFRPKTYKDILFDQKAIGVAHHSGTVRC